MKKILTVLVMLFCLSCYSNAQNAQNIWIVDSTMDDYTMKTHYVVGHADENGLVDAIYYLVDGEKYLCIYKNYSSPDYFEECHNGEIEDANQVISYRLIKSDGKFIERKVISIISYFGFGKGDKITIEDGFCSVFHIYCDPSQLKSSDYISFKYYDKISEDTISKNISLSGLSSCLSKLGY